MATTIAKTGYQLTLKGKSGKEYVFILYNGIPPLVKVGALYLFTKAERADALHTKIYLGRTADLSERFDAHHKAQCISEKGANFFGVLLMSVEKERIDGEADLLAVHSPSCNG